MRKLYTASEIANLRLPHLPTTKVGVRTFAAREKWRYEERTGVGGTRRVYEVPDHYFPGGEPAVQAAHEQPRGAKVIGTVVAGSAKIDPALLDIAVRALKEWEEARHIKVADDRRSAIVAVLYNHLMEAEGEGEDTMSVVLRELG